MSHSKHEAPKGFLYGAWAVTAITGFAFAVMAGFGIYNVTQSQIEASTASGVQVKEVKVNVDEQAFGGGTSSVAQKGSTTDTSAECKGTKIAINNYPGDALAKEKTNKFFIDAMGGKNYRCTNVCNNSGKSNDEFIKSLKISGQPVNTVSTGAELVTMVQQEPTKVASTIVLSSTKNECQGPISEEYSGLTDGNGEPVGVWKKNTTGEDTAKQAAQAGTDIQEAARPEEGGASTGLKVSTNGGDGTSTSDTSGTKTSSATSKTSTNSSDAAALKKCIGYANTQVQVAARWKISQTIIDSFNKTRNEIKANKDSSAALKKCNELLASINTHISQTSKSDVKWSTPTKGRTWHFNSVTWYVYAYQSKVTVNGKYAGDATWIPASPSESGYWSLRSTWSAWSGVYFKQNGGTNKWTEYNATSTASRVKAIGEKYYQASPLSSYDFTKYKNGSQAEKPSLPSGIPITLIDANGNKTSGGGGAGNAW